MPRLPRLSGREAAAVFERAGFGVRRQRGSHIILTRPGHLATLSVPDHEELKVGTLRSLIRKAGLTVDEFVALLQHLNLETTALTKTSRERRERLDWDYDEEADVLCVSICRPRKPAGVDIGQGVIVRYDEQRREVVGVRTCGIRRR